MYLVVIDTDKYAGNFEREMCAYITGVVGECEVGLKSKNVAIKELDQETVYWFAHNVAQMPDEHNVKRPCAIRATPGWFNDGVGNHWRDGSDLKEVRQKKIEWQIKYYTPLIEKAEKNIANGQHKWGERDLKGYKERIKEAETNRMDFESCQSVVIFFNSLPTDDIMNTIIDRAKKFCASDPTNIPGRALDITIENFQLIRTETVETVIWKGLKKE